MGTKITGLDQLIKKMEDLQKNAADAHGTHEVPLTELFDYNFMKKYTNFDDFEVFAEKSNFNWNDIESIDESQLDQFISDNSTFSSWSSMKTKAAEIWTVKKLGL